MMHAKRQFGVATVATAEELAVMLTDRTWTLCSGFCVAGHEQYLFLNDATHEDAAAEFSIIRGGLNGPWTLIESITMSWCSEQKALQYIRDILAGKYDEADYARPLTVHVQPAVQHDRCHLCA